MRQETRQGVGCCLSGDSKRIEVMEGRKGTATSPLNTVAAANETALRWMNGPEMAALNHVRGPRAHDDPPAGFHSMLPFYARGIAHCLSRARRSTRKKPSSSSGPALAGRVVARRRLLAGRARQVKLPYRASKMLQNRH